jgi:hypothetical protein
MNTAVTTGSDSDPLARPLIAFLEGDPQVREDFPAHLHDRLLKVARRVAPQLARKGLAEDVVQQMWVLLLQKSPGAFDPTRGTAINYLWFTMKTAARDIQASYTAPGQRTRPQRKAEGRLANKQPGRFNEEPVFRAEEPVSLNEMVWVEALGEEVELIESIQDDSDPMETVDDRLQVQWLLDLARTIAPEPVYIALETVYREEAGLTAAATVAGMHRSTLRRHIDRWANQRRLPLAI